MIDQASVLELRFPLVPDPSPDTERLIREREFFLGLLRLQAADAPQELLPEALRLLVDVVQAEQGYIELQDEDSYGDNYWHAVQGYNDEELEDVRRFISRGIIAEALAAGRMIHTASALQDPRFSEFESVRTQRIQAVLCAPIGRESTLGVVYLGGAPDAKPFDDHAEWLMDMFAHSLTPICERIVANARERQSEDLSKLLPFKGLIARSPAMKDVLAKLALAAPLDINILFTGRSGTGKSLLARAVHANSQRAARPFVEVNCAALPEHLIENELFGSGPGGHSTAPRTGYEGRVGAAEGGTLFLDDIGELAATAQAKLLQLLQSRSYFRLGESKLRRADVRILAATNADLDEAVRDQKFREDLLYRLRVLEVRVPALAERAEDVLPLVRHFLTQACARHGFDGIGLSPASLTAVQLAEWPGNVRQLAHAIEAGAVNAVVSESKFIEPEHLFGASESPASLEAQPRSLQTQLHSVRARIVTAALEESDWNVSEAARRLDVARSHLYKLIQAHNIRMPRQQRPSQRQS